MLPYWFIFIWDGDVDEIARETYHGFYNWHLAMPMILNNCSDIKNTSISELEKINPLQFTIIMFVFL